MSFSLTFFTTVGRWWLRLGHIRLSQE